VITFNRANSTAPAPASHRFRCDRGSISVEMAILAPVFVAFIVLAIVAGRSEVAYNAVAAAAHNAARAASIARTQDIAQQQASATAQTTLDDQGLDCASTTITVDASQLNRPVGEAATVTVSVSCQLDFHDVGIPMTRTLQTTFVSPVDTWRGRGLP
jgi:Flp pilus assembly protein TadG